MGGNIVYFSLQNYVLLYCKTQLGNLYIFEMDKGSRDIEQEFEDEYESFIPMSEVDSD